MSPRTRAPGGWPTLRWMSLALAARALREQLVEKLTPTRTGSDIGPGEDVPHGHAGSDLEPLARSSRPTARPRRSAPAILSRHGARARARGAAEASSVAAEVRNDDRERCVREARRLRGEHRRPSTVAELEVEDRSTRRAPGRRAPSLRGVRSRRADLRASLRGHPRAVTWRAHDPRCRRRSRTRLECPRVQCRRAISDARMPASRRPLGPRPFRRAHRRCARQGAVLPDSPGCSSARCSA
jgi:hypothetical protein